MAPRNIDPGSNYASQIVQAIRDSSALVLLASNHTKVYEATIKALKHNSLVKKRYPHFCQKDSLDPDE